MSSHLDYEGLGIKTLAPITGGNGQRLMSPLGLRNPFHSQMNSFLLLLDYKPSVPCHSHQHTNILQYLCNPFSYGLISPLKISLKLLTYSISTPLFLIQSLPLIWLPLPALLYKVTSCCQVQWISFCHLTSQQHLTWLPPHFIKIASIFLARIMLVVFHAQGVFYLHSFKYNLHFKKT